MATMDYTFPPGFTAKSMASKALVANADHQVQQHKRCVDHIVRQVTTAAGKGEFTAYISTNGLECEAVLRSMRDSRFDFKVQLDVTPSCPDVLHEISW